MRSRSMRSTILSGVVPIAGGALLAAGVAWVDGYHRNREAVWTIAGIGLVFGLAIIGIGLFADPRRVCERCGRRVVDSDNNCPKCGTDLSRGRRRSLPNHLGSMIPACRRFVSLGPWFVVAWIGAYLLLAFGSMLLSAAGAWRILGFAPFFLMGAAWMWFTRRRSRQLETRLLDADGRLCSVCLYPRNDGSDRCPECGVRETEDELRALWERSGLWMRVDAARDPSENPTP